MRPFHIVKPTKAQLMTMSVGLYPMLRRSLIVPATISASSQGQGWRDHAARPNAIASHAQPAPRVPDSDD